MAFFQFQRHLFRSLQARGVALSIFLFAPTVLTDIGETTKLPQIDSRTQRYWVFRNNKGSDTASKARTADRVLLEHLSEKALKRRRRVRGEIGGDIHGTYTCGYDGTGLTAGALDERYKLGHPSFEHLDIIDNCNFVFDNEDVPTQSSHATGVLSLLAGYDPDNFVGVAPGVSVLLVKPSTSP